MPALRITNPNASERSAIVYIDLVSVVPLNKRGDNKYVFKLSTQAKDCNGDVVQPLMVYDTSINGFFKALPKALADLCKDICWGEENTDRTAPFVSYYGPTGNDVSLFSSVIIGLEDALPSNGIDPNSIHMTVNGFDVSDKLIIEGQYNKLTVSWSPERRVVNG